MISRARSAITFSRGRGRGAGCCVGALPEPTPSAGPTSNCFKSICGGRSTSSLNLKSEPLVSSKTSTCRACAFGTGTRFDVWQSGQVMCWPIWRRRTYSRVRQSLQSKPNSSSADGWTATATGGGAAGNGCGAGTGAVAGAAPAFGLTGPDVAGAAADCPAGATVEGGCGEAGAPAASAAAPGARKAALHLGQ